MRIRKESSGSAFTLIELLVVVAIIGVLISILLPTLSAAREKARQAACMSNLKHVGIANLLYADDYNGWTVSAVTWPDSASVPWGKILASYHYIDDINGVDLPPAAPALACPSKIYSSSNTRWLREISNDGYYFTYGFVTYWEGSRFHLKIFSDSVTIRFNYPPYDSVDLNRPPHKMPLVGDSVSIWPPVVESRASCRMYWPRAYTDFDGHVVHLIHNGVANILLADGHVDSFNKDTLKMLGFGSRVSPVTYCYPWSW